MIFLNPIVFWLFVLMGLFYGACALIISILFKKINNPTENEIRRKNRLFSLFFLGFLIFTFTPILIALMLMPI